MSTAVRAGTDRDAFTRAAAGQAMDDPTGRPEIAHGGKPPTAPSRRPHIVIIGAGFGGLSAATGLGRAAAVTVIDQRNHHLVPAAALSSRHSGPVARRHRGANPRHPLTSDRLAVVVPDLSARRPADHRVRQCDGRDLYRIEAITDRNFRFPMGATVVNGDTAASGAVSAKGNHPMNRNLFFDPIALRANAVPTTVES
jgi:hypothetical protein